MDQKYAQVALRISRCKKIFRNSSPDTRAFALRAAGRGDIGQGSHCPNNTCHGSMDGTPALLNSLAAISAAFYSDHEREHLVTRSHRANTAAVAGREMVAQRPRRLPLRAQSPQADTWTLASCLEAADQESNDTDDVHDSSISRVIKMKDKVN